ncbi:hypothetical protein [Tenacibaculum xiamenense]|uniref:hypothetical protein n=1 Tax=Tenacibaculum xiamenense TaxID=1261553 RepID=UPI00389413C5
MKTLLKYFLISAFICLTSCSGNEDESMLPHSLSNKSIENDTNYKNLLFNGPDAFDQVPWPVNYEIWGESIPIPGDHTLTGPNPVLDELNDFKDYVSNVPLTLEVSSTGGSWYKRYKYTFTNRSQESMHVDAAVFMFVGPKNTSGERHVSILNNVDGHGHPQQDFVEVPLGNGADSYYIARLVFHDVPEAKRTLTPGSSLVYMIGFPMNPFSSPYGISVENSMKTVRFIADLSGNKNEDLVRKYGTKRYTN